MDKIIFKVKVPAARNRAVMAMMKRSQKAGAHLDRKKEARKQACRGRQVMED